MFFPEGQIRVYVYGQPVDMRRSYDGLYALTRNAMGQDPLSGHLYAFINRRGHQATFRIPVMRLRRTQGRDHRCQQPFGAGAHIHRPRAQPQRIDADHFSTVATSRSQPTHCWACATGQRITN